MYRYHQHHALYLEIHAFCLRISPICLDFSVKSRHNLKICRMCLGGVFKNRHQFFSVGPIKRRACVLYSGHCRPALPVQTITNCRSCATPKFVTLCFVIVSNLNKTKPKFQRNFGSDFQTSISRCILTFRGYTRAGYPYCIPQ